ncbi:hypothetical protein LBMAG30_13850 [Comamonadaceae bacterium]|nr:hypothetical protein LBMAG30_13850 [Comamonadaceae bacterium]
MAAGFASGLAIGFFVARTRGLVAALGAGFAGAFGWVLDGFVPVFLSAGLATGLLGRAGVGRALLTAADLAGLGLAGLDLALAA